MTAANLQQVCCTSMLCGKPPVPTCSSDRCSIEQAQWEICVHAALQCEHTVALYAAFEDEDGVYLVQACAAADRAALHYLATSRFA